MRPTFEDIRNRIKYLLRTFKVCVADILTGTVSASNNGGFFSALFSVSVHLYSLQTLLKKISLVNFYHVVCDISQTH